MITAPEIVESRVRMAAVIRLTIPRDEIRHVMPGSIRELQSVLREQGVGPVGAMFTHHLTTSRDLFDFELGFPVSAPVAATGRVKPGELPASLVARAVHHGGYEGLFSAWAEFGRQVAEKFGDWMRQAGLRPGKTFWESYVTGPESSPDPSVWRTELNLPLVANNSAG